MHFSFRVGKFSDTFYKNRSYFCILVHPKVDINQPRQLELERGDTKSITCTVSGYPVPVITWTKQRGSIDPDRINLIEDENERRKTSTLLFRTVNIFFFYSDFIYRQQGYTYIRILECEIRLLQPLLDF